MTIGPDYANCLNLSFY